MPLLPLSKQGEPRQWRRRLPNHTLLHHIDIPLPQDIVIKRPGRPRCLRFSGVCGLSFLAGLVRLRIELTSQERMTNLYLESASFGAETVSAIRIVSSFNTGGEGLLSQHITLYQGSMRDNALFGIAEAFEVERERFIQKQRREHPRFPPVPPERKWY
ncbi:hypothetical protein A1O7_03028 [Cladophialophora yegresii CBS 114405]|uniref:Uncharacterized protein n=1 Tax=Cladophialophora yegresii CBS 114405 TaxID=1182544 RepID=W9WC78_9EURO|nr:uncharacterized protein A1O7_03028 [Cladophialophora yegresii CBS 114405]EXJ62590.1 hypothetical protein A1O7_03028 [Cladophialophora yegresii CBS 114405]